MSSRARRIAEPVSVSRFDWEQVAGAGEAGDPEPSPADPNGPREVADDEADPQTRLAALERDAFTRGYASGERAGLEAGARRADGMLRRMAQTVEELERLKVGLVRQTERQVVQLALALARRIVLREVSLDPDLVGAMAHVALERLGDASPATVHLHPEDYAVVLTHRGGEWAGTNVSVVPDPALPRGGCLVESGFGVIDASVETQLGELAAALLGDTAGLGPEAARAE